VPEFAAAQSIPLLKIGGYLQVKEVAHQDVGLTATLNRARFSIDGTLPAYFIEIAPNRVRLLLDGVRRTSGAKQTRTDTLIAQLQVRF
jgi:hypothetical protein